MIKGRDSCHFHFWRENQLSGPTNKKTMNFFPELATNPFSPLCWLPWISLAHFPSYASAINFSFAHQMVESSSNGADQHGQVEQPSTSATVNSVEQHQLGQQNNSKNSEESGKLLTRKAAAKDADDFVDRIGESARNRFGRPYISGRPLLLCDRRKIIRLYGEGRRKIAIAREIGVTHSCVSKVIRRYEETGELENKNSRTASCACPGEAENHDLRVCRHVRFNRFRAEQQQQSEEKILFHQQRKSANEQAEQGRNGQQNSAEKPNDLPKKFSVEWILSEL